MPRSNALIAASLCCALLALTGCLATGVRFLNLVGLSEKPLVFTLVADERELDGSAGTLLDPYAPYKPLNQALGAAAKRNVVPNLNFLFQVPPNLDLGVTHIVVASSLQYAQIERLGDYPAVAMAVDAAGRTARPGVLLVKADSAIEQVRNLKGKRVAFGPANQARTHHAGLLLLDKHGVKKSDLKLELLPLPGSLLAVTDPAARLKLVEKGEADAAFVDLAVWEKWTAESAAEADRARAAGCRQLDRTIPLPIQVVVRSPHLDPELAARVQSFLTTVHETNPEALKPLGFKAFAMPNAAELKVCDALMTVEQLLPSAEPKQPAGSEAAAQTPSESTEVVLVSSPALAD